MAWNLISRAAKWLIVSAILTVAFASFFAAAADISTFVTTIPAVVTLTQDTYRWYSNVDALDPSNQLAAEDVAVSVPGAGTQLRLRMNVHDGGVQLDPGNAFRLQYANATSGPWTDLSTSTAWTFFDNPSVADGQIVVNTLLGNSSIGESYDESNPSAASPAAISTTQSGEWDWSIVNNSAATDSNWFFRMVHASGTVLDFYANYPQLAAVPPAPSPSPSSISHFQAGGGGTGYAAPVPETPPSLPVPPPILQPSFQAADFNGDNRIDIVDLSIMLYYYHDTGPEALRYDLNKDGSIDFPDVSILMYYWTE